MVGLFLVMLCFGGLIVGVALVLWLQRHARRLDDLEKELRSLRAPAARPAVEHGHAAAPGTPIPPAPPPHPPLPPLRPPPAVAREHALEELIGGVWLQHAGAGLVLLGVLLFLVWGYASGNLPPIVLVLGGIALGAAFFWRGDRVGHSMPAFGHALIGVGIGVAYISVYLGHFLLRALSAPVTFPLLAATSFAAVLAGRRYGVQSIAALGVLGAYLPELIGVWVPVRGFRLTPVELLGHLALVNAFVFALAASVGWSRLALWSLLLAAGTWIVNATAGHYGWPVEIGFAALFASLGLSGLPRLARPGTRVAGADVAVAAFAPLALLLCSLPFFAHVSKESSGALLLALAGLYGLAAGWVGTRRGEDDLWRPLTAAAAVFLAGALERFLGEGARIAWAAEAFVLLAIGIGARSTWLRICGYVVGAITWVWSTGATILVRIGPEHLSDSYAVQLRTLACVLLGLRGARLLSDERPSLSHAEQRASEVTTGAAHALLLLWSSQQASVFVSHLGGVGSDWRPALVLGGSAIAWALQSAALFLAGGRPDRVFLRALGYGVGAMGLFATLQALVAVPELPLVEWDLHVAVSALTFAAIAIASTISIRLDARRATLTASERNASEGASLAANVSLLVWTQVQARTVALVLASPSALGPGPLGSFLTSLVWLAQALAVFTFGWTRASAFLRWLGLGLLGVTILKFLLFDLRGESAFWRFLIAILAGVVFLGISYAYQRRAPGRAADR